MSGSVAHWHMHVTARYFHAHSLEPGEFDGHEHDSLYAFERYLFERNTPDADPRAGSYPVILKERNEQAN